MLKLSHQLAELNIKIKIIRPCTANEDIYLQIYPNHKIKLNHLCEVLASDNWSQF